MRRTLNGPKIIADCNGPFEIVSKTAGLMIDIINAPMMNPLIKFVIFLVVTKTR